MTSSPLTGDPAAATALVADLAGADVAVALLAARFAEIATAGTPLLAVRHGVSPVLLTLALGDDAPLLADLHARLDRLIPLVRDRFEHDTTAARYGIDAPADAVSDRLNLLTRAIVVAWMAPDELPSRAGELRRTGQQLRTLLRFAAGGPDRLAVTVALAASWDSAPADLLDACRRLTPATE